MVETKDETFLRDLITQISLCLLLCVTWPILLAIFLLILFLCPPLSIYIISITGHDYGTFKWVHNEYGGSDDYDPLHFCKCLPSTHYKMGRNKALIICLLLCLLGWIPGIVWALVLWIYFAYNLIFGDNVIEQA